MIGRQEELAQFFPNYSNENKLIAYGILGGIPRYLEAFDDKLSIQKNIENEILRNGAFLNDEVQMLLRMEFREPGTYNSILEAIAGGHNTLTRIADRIQEDRSKVSKYLLALQSIKLIKRQTPTGESTKSRKAIYVMTDNYYRFWYRYVFANRSYYEMLGTKDAAKEIIDDMPNFMGPVFEDICKDYLIRQAQLKKLPFVPFSIGRWWGNNPTIQQQDDIDILALNKKQDAGMFCECKFRNKAVSIEEYENLVTATTAFPDIKQKHLIFFSKGGYTDAVKKRATQDGTMLLGTDDVVGDRGFI